MFAFRLAKELGWWDVDQLLAAMPLRLFLEWMAYNELEPIGEERGDLRAGIIASTVANAMSSSRKRFKAKDFMPDFGRVVKRQTPDEMRDVFMRFAAAHNAALRRKHGGN